MTCGNKTLHFTYSPTGSPVSVTYDGASYYYVLSLQGDVMGLADSSGQTVVAYVYDAWGRLLSTEGDMQFTLGLDNPLRYRGYVYDRETGLYYLESRYYNPATSRFINADSAAATGQGLLGNNMFAYCNNNPVVRQDNSGEAFETVFDVLSLGASILEVAFNPADPFAWLGLVGDAVDLIPFVTAVGETIRTLKFGSKVVEGTDNAVDTYRALRKITKGSDLEVHHIVEKRFSKQLGYGKSGGNMPSVALSKGNHRTYTNMWREYLPYGSVYDDKRVLQTAITIYANEPELLGSALFTIAKKRL